MYLKQYCDTAVAAAPGTTSTTLSNAEVEIFDGDPVNYCNGIRSFENLIKDNRRNSSTRLYHLVQNREGFYDGKTMYLIIKAIVI